MVYVYIKAGYITETTRQTSGHHWANPHGCWVGTDWICKQLQLSKHEKHLYNICSMLDQRRRRWADFVQMLY